jgi:hypothetical protein
LRTILSECVTGEKPDIAPDDIEVRPYSAMTRRDNFAESDQVGFLKAGLFDPGAGEQDARVYLIGLTTLSDVLILLSYIDAPINW